MWYSYIYCTVLAIVQETSGMQAYYSFSLATKQQTKNSIIGLHVVRVSELKKKE